MKPEDVGVAVKGIVDALEPLAARLGVAASQLLTWAVRQAYVEAIRDVVTGGVLFTIAFVCVLGANSASKSMLGDDPVELAPMIVTVCVLTAVICGIAGMICLSDGLVTLANPEWHGFQILTTALLRLGR